MVRRFDCLQEKKKNHLIGLNDQKGGTSPQTASEQYQGKTHRAPSDAA